MIIGITGSIGTGKTTVARMFAKLSSDAKILDADRLSHMALKKGSSTYNRIISYFGKAVLNSNRSINRKKLAGVVFNDRKKLMRLIGIIHPFVIREIKKFIKGVDIKRKLVIIDAPLLIEAELTNLVDKLIVVRTDRRTQLSRCMKKRNLKKEEVMARIRNQIPLARKVDLADYVIDNSGTFKQTKKKVSQIWEKVKS